MFTQAILLAISMPSPHHVSLYQELVTAQNARATVVGGRSAVEVHVVNHTQSIMTAWRVQISFRWADGRPGSRARWRDSYESVTPVGDNGKAVNPGAFAREVFLIGPSGSSPVEAVTASITWAVFADGSWIGDPTGVQEVFRHRQQDEEAWALIADAVRDGRAVGGKAGLARALEALNRIDQSDYNNPNKGVMRRNLEMAIKGHPAIRVDANEFLRMWLMKAEAQRDAAAAQRQQKLRRAAR